MITLNSKVGVRELALANVATTPFAYSNVRGREDGYVVVRDATGLIVQVSPIKNILVNTGLNWILQNALQTGTLYLGAIAIGSGGSSGISSASVSSSSTSCTLGAATSWSANQHLTIIGAGTSGANLSDQASGSGSSSTALTLSTAAGTTVSSATLVWGPVFSASDTPASHSGWTEVASSQLTSGTRPTYTQATIGSNTYVTNSGNGTNLWTLASGAATQWWTGFFLVTNSTVGGTSGTLISEFVPTVGALSVGASYTVSLTYQVSMTSSATS